MIQMSQASDGRGLGRSVHQAAWHVCRPSTPFLCVAASVEIDLVFAADACCGRLHEKCCVAHACSVLHSLEEPAPLPTSLWSCPDLWHESVACIVTGEIHKPSQEEVDPLFAVWHEIPRFLFHLCQTLLRVCGHAQTFGTSLRPVLSMTICTDSRPFKI